MRSRAITGDAETKPGVAAHPRPSAETPTTRFRRTGLRVYRLELEPDAEPHLVVHPEAGYRRERTCDSRD